MNGMRCERFKNGCHVSKEINPRNSKHALIEFKIEPRDIWIGLYWKRDYNSLDLYFCPLPCLLLHLSFWDFHLYQPLENING